jgi:hypothetical protein
VQRNKKSAHQCPPLRNFLYQRQEKCEMAGKYDSVNMEEDHDQLCTPSVQTDSDREEGAASVFRSPIPGQTTGIDHFGQLTDFPTGFGPIRSEWRENRHNLSANVGLEKRRLEVECHSRNVQPQIVNRHSYTTKDEYGRHNLAPTDGLEEIRLMGHRMAIERGTFDGSHSSRALDDYNTSHSKFTKEEFTERKLRAAETHHKWMLEMEELKIMEETQKREPEERSASHYTAGELRRIIEECEKEEVRRQKQEIQRREQLAREEQQLRINEECHRLMLEEEERGKRHNVAYEGERRNEFLLTAEKLMEELRNCQEVIQKQGVQKELSSRTVPMENRGQQKTHAPREIRRSSGYMSSTSEEEESQQTGSSRHTSTRLSTPGNV